SGAVIRLYENSGARVTAHVEFGREASAVELTNLLEEASETLVSASKVVEVPFGPFEIQTLKVLD
ncbi:MAG: hypothetical protein IT319_20775, partial [Anaerolineae bacterium]|nr:hypothetical protein [Anaerolineae bacterium]